MQKKNVCKCGSSSVVYVVQKGRGKKAEAFCEKCLPVVADGKDTKADASNQVMERT